LENRLNKVNLGEELVVGVIGGMGPQATADFLTKLVRATPVSKEQEHLHVLIDSNPKVPDRNLAIACASISPGFVLAAMAKTLQDSGAGFVVMPCNTAHAFESSIRECISIPFINMIEEACDVCARDHPCVKRIGVLAAPGCISAGLYQAALARRGMEALVLNHDDQQRFNSILYRIKLNDPSQEVRSEMQVLGNILIASGADVILAGCTEVPLVLEQSQLSRPLIDATWNLAQRCVRYARRLEPIPNHFHTLTH
jgi:aspartate racemase